MRSIFLDNIIKKLLAALTVLLMCLSLCAAPISVLAAPDDETSRSSSETAAEDGADEDSETAADDSSVRNDERGTIRGKSSSSDTDSGSGDKPSATKSPKKNADSTDEDSEDEASDESEPEPSPTRDPRVDENGRPVMDANQTAVLINATNGEVMFEQEKDKRVYPASTTKIMTALLTLEAIDRGELNLHAAFLVMPEMLADLPADGSSMLLKEGETITVEQLLQGLMVESGNDAAQALAIIVCGDIPTFVQRMNDRAAELGMSGTHFVNVHGLHDDEHYTTAADLATLTLEAMKNNTFRELAATPRVVIPATDKTTQRTFISTNGLLSTLRYPNYYYENAIGVKTGHTSQAGYCLVSAGQKGALEVIGVVMNGADEDDRHFDSKNLLKYALDNYKAVTAVTRGDMVSEIRVRFGSGTDHTTLSTDSDILVTIPEDANEDELSVEARIPEYLVAPVNQGDEIGTVEVMYQGSVVGSGRLIADSGVKRHPLGFLMQFFSFLWSILFVRILIIVLLIALVLFIVYMIVNIRKNIKIAERRRRASSRRPPRDTRR